MNSLPGLKFISHCPCCGSSNVRLQNAVLAPFFAARALGLEPVEIGIGEFRDLAPGTSYQPCNSIYCNHCMSVSCSARLSPASMYRYYQGYQDQEFIDMRGKYEPSFVERMKTRTNPNTLRIKGEACSYANQVESYYLEVTGKRQPSAVLDYGGGTGVNTPFRSHSHIMIVDIDQSNAQANDARRPESIDLICLMNVLEHVNYPLEVLRTALRGCRNACDVLIEVPLERFMHDLASISSYTSKKIWTEHINCFSPMGLMNLAKAAGLEPYGTEPRVMKTSMLDDNRAEENCMTILLACKYPS